MNYHFQKHNKTFAKNLGAWQIYKSHVNIPNKNHEIRNKFTCFANTTESSISYIYES